jgi:hypothetical protein
MYSKFAKALAKVVEFTLGKQVSPKLSQFFLWIKKNHYFLLTNIP